jgi:hypothetical protein
MNPNSPREEGNPGYEISDAHTRPIWITAGTIILSVAAIFVGITLMFVALHRHDIADQLRSRAQRVTNAVAETRPQYPEPRLQVAPQVDLAALRTRENTELTTYGWIDRGAGVVRIPIDRAIDLLAQRGLPVRGDPNAPKATRTSLDMQQARPLQREPAKEGR